MLVANSNLQWNSEGVLPPIFGGTSPNRLPYRTNLAVFAQRFAISQERKNILDGFLRFRAELHAIGLIDGFQWLDGSFLENIETLENRPPRDLDVVTFYKLPENTDKTGFWNTHANFANTNYLKTKYQIDGGFFIDLGEPMDSEAIHMVTYWYSMWSHRRNRQWKGYVEVDLANGQDQDAKNILDSITFPKEKEVFSVTN